VVARMKALRDKALAEMAGDPPARQAFLYWTWTFDEFLKYADGLCGTATPVANPAAPAAAGMEPGLPASKTNVVRESGGSGSTPTALSPVTKTNAADGAEMALVPAGEFLMGTSDEERAAWLAAHPDRSRTELIRLSLGVPEEKSFFKDFFLSASDGQRAAWLAEPPGPPPEDLFKFRDEAPQRKVHLDAFYMYKTEVTVGQYGKFCKATGRAMPPEPRAFPAPRAKLKPEDSLPIVKVSWDEARAYAEWAGAALPTEAEWEKAARGGDRRVFPWGDAWPPPQGAGNFLDLTFGALPLRIRCYIDGYNDGAMCTAPVGAFTANPYGLHDMAGNVAEWCADWYDAGYYRTGSLRNPAGPDRGVWRVVRGGSWHDGTPWSFRVASRGDYVHLPVGTHSFIVGFRCVVRAP